LAGRNVITLWCTRKPLDDVLEKIEAFGVSFLRKTASKVPNMKVVNCEKAKTRTPG